MMLVPFADAVQRVAALIDGGLLDRLAGNEWLKESFVDTVVYWHDKKARNLLVWLTHNGALTPLKEDKTGITLFIDKGAKAFFRLYDEDTKAWNHGEYGYDAIADDAVFFDADEFDLLEGFLSHKQTSFLDWQLAYIWAGKEPPLGYEIALSGQNEPHPLPRAVEDRLKRIRQSLPADGQTGRLRLYAWAGFPAFANQQGHPLPNTSHVIDSASNEVLSKHRKSLEADALKLSVLKEIDKGIDPKHRGLAGLIHFAIGLDEAKQDEERREILSGILSGLLERVAQDSIIRDEFTTKWGRYLDEKETMRKFLNHKSMEDDPRVQRASKERKEFFNAKFSEFLRRYERFLRCDAERQPSDAKVLRDVAETLKDLYKAKPGLDACWMFECYLEENNNLEGVLKDFNKEKEDFWTTAEALYEQEMQSSNPSKSDIGQQDQESIFLGNPPVIPYLVAKPKIQALFPSVTKKEILIWVETAAYAAPINKQLIPRNANGTILNFGSLDKDDAYDGEDDDRVDSILVPLYFSEQEWQEANPERWLTYQQLKEVVFEAGISESELMASILMYLGSVDIYDQHKWGKKVLDIYDPIPRRRREVEAVNRKDKLKTALYRAGWIQETFPRVDLGWFRKVDVSAGVCAKNMGELNGHSGSLEGEEPVKLLEAVAIDSQQEEIKIVGQIGILTHPITTPQPQEVFSPNLNEKTPKKKGRKKGGTIRIYKEIDELWQRNSYTLQDLDKCWKSLEQYKGEQDGSCIVTWSSKELTWRKDDGNESEPLKKTQFKTRMRKHLKAVKPSSAKKSVFK